MMHVSWPGAEAPILVNMVKVKVALAGEGNPYQHIKTKSIKRIW